MKPYWCVCMAYTTHTPSLIERMNQPLIFFSPTKNRPVDPIAASAHDHISPLPHNSGNVVTYQVGSHDKYDNSCVRFCPEISHPLCVEALFFRWTHLGIQQSLPHSLLTAFLIARSINSEKVKFMRFMALAMSVSSSALKSITIDVWSLMGFPVCVCHSQGRKMRCIYGTHLSWFQRL